VTDQDTTAPLGLRERKKRATRAALQQAALELVSERGLEHVTTDDIAAAVDVSPRTFFNYFPSKEAAVVGADPERAARLRRALLDRPTDESPLEALRAVWVTQADAMAGDVEMWRRRLAAVEANPALRPALVASFTAAERALAAAVAERTGTDVEGDPYPMLVAGVAAAAMRAALHHCRAIDFARPLAEVLGETFTTVMHGLPAPTR
jgi:AcrR family transcriptional regulator